MGSPHLGKIIWAVNILDEKRARENVLYTLGSLTRDLDAAIEPVFILSPPYARVSEDIPSEIEEAYEALAEKRLSEIAKSSDLPSIQPGKILVNRAGLLRKDVESLIDEAEAFGAGMIVVSTHARQGLPRLFLGSFAETLILQSRIPVLAVNPDTKVRERISRLLFPTTFNEVYRESFEHAVKLARTLSAELTLYYKEPFVEASLMSPEFYGFLAADSAERRDASAEWKDFGLQNGVKVEVVLDNRPGYAADAVLDYATENNVDLILVASRADRISAAVSGSMARTVMRKATCPVCVIRADGEE